MLDCWIHCFKCHSKSRFMATILSLGFSDIILVIALSDFVSFLNCIESSNFIIEASNLVHELIAGFSFKKL